MVNDILVAIITWSHIVSVICWSGAAIIFLAVISPTLPKLSAQANGEVALRLLPRYLRFIQVFAVFTLIFGPLLALTMNDGPPNSFDLVSPWSILVTAGAITGIVMLFVVFLFLTPTVRRLVRMVRQMQETSQPPPPSEMRIVQRRFAIGGPLSVVLLLLAEVFMVSAAQF